MRHLKNRGMKLGSDAAHTRAIKRSLVNSLFLNDRIKTTEARAKAIRGNVDRIITWAKRGDIHSRRLALAQLNDKEIVREVFEKVEQGMWADRSCGFTRIYKLGPRKGDNAPMVIMELVTEPVQAKKKADAKPAKAAVSEVKPAEAAKTEEAAKAEETADAPVATDENADAPVAVEETPAAEATEEKAAQTKAE